MLINHCRSRQISWSLSKAVVRDRLMEIRGGGFFHIHAVSRCKPSFLDVDKGVFVAQNSLQDITYSSFGDILRKASCFTTFAPLIIFPTFLCIAFVFMFTLPHNFDFDP